MNMKRAAIINAIGKYSKVFLQLLVSAILSRILSAEDYGIVAIITVFTTFFTTLADMGFGTAIIQNRDLSNEDINNIYSFTVYISVVLSLAFGGFSFLIAYFYGDSVYISLGFILSISLLFNALNMVPNGMMSKEKKFVQIAFRTVIVYVGSAVVAIVLALLEWRYYALAVQAVVTAFFTFIWNWNSTKPKFKLRFSISSIKKVASYSGFQFAFNFVNYFSRNLDNLLTGRFLGNAELGYYNKAYNLMLYPVNNLTGVVSPVLHPILADYQKQKEIIYEKYIKVVKLLGGIGIYVAPVCYLAASEMISILYGDQWVDSTVCFQILSIAIVTQMINSSAGSIFQVLGDTKLLFVNGIINTIITSIAILIGIFIGGSIKSLSYCVTVAYILHFCTVFYMLIKMGFGYSLLRFINDIRKEIIILIIMVVAVVLYPISINNIVISLLVKCIYLGIFYLSGLLLTGEHKVFFKLLKR